MTAASSQLLCSAVVEDARVRATSSVSRSRSSGAFGVARDTDAIAGASFRSSSRALDDALRFEAAMCFADGDVAGSEILCHMMARLRSQNTLPCWRGPRKVETADQPKLICSTLLKSTLSQAERTAADRVLCGARNALSAFAASQQPLNAPNHDQRPIRPANRFPAMQQQPTRRPRPAPRFPSARPRPRHPGTRQFSHEPTDPPMSGGFRTARTALSNDGKRKFSDRRLHDAPPPARGPPARGPRPFKAPAFKPPGRLGGPPRERGRGPRGQIPRSRGNSSSARPRFDVAASAVDAMSGKFDASRGGGGSSSIAACDPDDLDPRLKGLDPALIERIENEVLDLGEPITFNDIAGLEFAKGTVEELVIWPIQNPELFTGLRKLPKGLLLFGPPGTGKTLIGKAIAHECKATFFSISASSLTSKWIGEGEKTVRALFGVAAVKQPSVVFIDEIDSLLTQRTSEENEASRRIKTEFLVQLDGAATLPGEMVLVIGATNRPQELDEAARRRFVKRLYIPLPDRSTRIELLSKLLQKNSNTLTRAEIEDLATRTDGYSGADIANLAGEASMWPLRDRMKNRDVQGKGLRDICHSDFVKALKSIRASVSGDDLTGYVQWDNTYGTQRYVS